MTGTFRILVTGTREDGPLTQYMVHGHLDRLATVNAQGRRVVILHGKCPKGGVDLRADQWARQNGHTVEQYPADWQRHGKAAGPQRNAQMVATRPDWCIGFPGPGSQGTWDCLRKAVDAGIPTEVYVIAGASDVRS